MTIDAKFFRRFRTFALSGAALLAAVLLATALWRHYMISPWTRDGRVRAETVSIAPEVAGTVTDLRVSDNQGVHKGDVLFVIDPRSYRIAVDAAKAALEAKQHAADLAEEKAKRRAQLSDLSVSTEEKRQYHLDSRAAAASVDEARAALAAAELNLERTVVRSPVNGVVTNLHLRRGDFLGAGQASLAVIDSESYWLAGYFEETQLAAIHPGDEAHFVLMGYPDRVFGGKVDSISRGIADQDGGAGGAALANVNPVFTWVRLAQRIPVRIALGEVSDETPMRAGLTATISIGPRETLGAELAWAWRFWTRGWRY
ncbi:RND family efflux transporter, MFP subunit [Rhodoblastus acidophilus]|uniref:RND family efflux transporter, MFP subunit n=1 Tax=Rhodoblastus acidophilus TaxID=1074 RepID=A0A212PW18_RHOAC|nr:HlyD family secretion protein [Rhodoblastus acidophilus]MCW2316710.1 multidrug resistance efflux pump [Rhodoblastus acidophilus]PPQ37823.1 HlyD family secretion protein [Rhodoblastus acidophilus]RAI17221.1 HlyD family secretion protein [Rhodoblastus acidophilus]SNB51152.1 RND family efflux transporter, MFP subunit [Rhodoblastus acidophilus]